MNQEILSLRKDSAELNQVLLRGTVTRYGETWLALPRETVANPDGIEAVIFEIVRSDGMTKPGFFRRWAQAIRIESLTMTLMPGVTLISYGLFRGWDPHWAVGILALVGVLFFHISVNLLNDVEDHLRLLDLPKKLSGSGVIQKGWFSARALRLRGFTILSLGVLLGLPAVVQAPHILFSVGAFGALGVIGYSNQPFAMKYRALGDYCIFLLLGPLLAIGYSGAFFQRYDAGALCLGLFFGFLAWAIHHLAHIPQIPSDSGARVKTLASKIGFKKARHLLVALYSLAYACILGGVFLGVLPLRWTGGAALIVSPWIFRLILKVYRSSGPLSARLSSARSTASGLHFWLGVAVSIGFALSN